MGSGAVEQLAQASRLGEGGAPMLEVALALVAGGFPVFPCGPDKRPLIARGFKARSRDEAQVRQWWARYPDALPAIVPGDVGLAAFDIDSNAAAAAACAVGVSLDQGFIVETAGTSTPFQFEGVERAPLHVYVAVAAEPRVPGVVVRHCKGYVIAPGARRASRTYRVRVAGEPLVFDHGTGSAPTPDTKREGVPEVDLERVRAAVRVIQNTAETTREQYVGMTHTIRAVTGEVGREIFLDWAATWPGGADPTEDARVWDTLPRTTTDKYVLWRLAGAHGFDASPERSAEAQEEFGALPAPTLSMEMLARLVPPPLSAVLHALHRRLKAIPDALERDARRLEALAVLYDRTRIPFRELQGLLAQLDAPNRTLTPRVIRLGTALRDAVLASPATALVPGCLYAGAQHVLYGAPQAYKTFVALDWALRVATGTAWRGRPIPKGGVVFYGGEGTLGLLVRIAAWCARRGISVAESAAAPFALIDTLPTLGMGDDGLQDAVARTLGALHGPSLIVIDNMTRLANQAGLSTVDPSELGRILAGIDALGRATGAATLLIAHTSRSDPDEVSGSYPMTAYPDVLIRAKREATMMQTRLEVTKSRDAAAPDPLLCTLQSQDVRSWLEEGFRAEALPVPSVLVDDFETPVGSSGAAVEGPSLSSLVVVDAAVAPTAIRAAAERDAGVEAEVVAALGSAGPLAKTAVRERVQRGHAAVDRALDALTTRGVITRTPKGGSFVFTVPLQLLTGEGPTQVAA